MSSVFYNKINMILTSPLLRVGGPLCWLGVGRTRNRKAPWSVGWPVGNRLRSIRTLVGCCRSLLHWNSSTWDGKTFQNPQLHLEERNKAAAMSWRQRRVILNNILIGFSLSTQWNYRYYATLLPNFVIQFEVEWNSLKEQSWFVLHLRAAVWQSVCRTAVIPFSWKILAVGFCTAHTHVYTYTGHTCIYMYIYMYISRTEAIALYI